MEIPRLTRSELERRANRFETITDGILIAALAAIPIFCGYQIVKDVSHAERYDAKSAKVSYTQNSIKH